MRKLFLALTLFISLCTHAQKIEKFFDYNWKACNPVLARYYAVIEFKDSLWFRGDYFIREEKLQMAGSYRDSSTKIPHGLFHYFYANGSLSSTGSYVNGKKQGLWTGYYKDGTMRDSAFYKNGRPTGTAFGWHSNGYPKDSSVYSDDGMTVRVEWFDNGVLSSAGRILRDTLHGKWVFFHKNGKMSASEIYNRGTLISREYYDEKGNPMTDTTNHDSRTEFNGGSKAWTKYMNSKLYFPDQYKITGGDKAVVVVEAVIDEDGNLTDLEVTSPFYPAFDEIALKMMKNAPKWKPAIHHNRKVKDAIRQPVIFNQTEE